MVQKSFQRNLIVTNLKSYLAIFSIKSVVFKTNFHKLEKSTFFRETLKIFNFMLFQCVFWVPKESHILKQL